MKKFLIGLVAGVLLAFLTGFILVFALIRVGEPAPSVQAGSTLVISLHGEAPERPPFQLPLPALESRSPATVLELWAMLERAATDPKIQAVALFPRGVEIGWGKMQEIRDGLLKFKKSGKPLVAYLRNPGTREYYLATAADAIYMSREDLLDLKGLRVEAMYLRDTLNKLGVEVEIEHAGKYKDAGDMLTRTSMSPETREVMNSILDEVYSYLTQTIAESRDRTPEEVRALLDEGPFLAADAVKAGLVDKLVYEDEMFDLLKERLGQKEIHKLSHHRYLKAAGKTEGQRIAFVVGSGSIIAGSSSGGFGEDEALWSRDFIRTLRDVRKDDGIKGVILRIDSPGGDAIASDEILREVRLLHEKKPMVISMSDMAASGGYYIAMTGDPVLAYRNTYTGSIGVLFGKVNLRGLYDKIGVRKEILTRGRFAAIDSDYQPLNKEGRAKLREGINSVYDGFLRVVSEGRNKQRGEIEPLAQGRVWLGIQAERNGLVDELGGLDRAVALIKEKAGIGAGEHVRLIPYPKKRSFWEYLMNQGADTLTMEGELTHLSKLVNGPDLRLFQHGNLLRLMPYSIDVR